MYFSRTPIYALFENDAAVCVGYKLGSIRHDVRPCHHTVFTHHLRPPMYVMFERDRPGSLHGPQEFSNLLALLSMSIILLPHAICNSLRIERIEP